MITNMTLKEIRERILMLETMKTYATDEQMIGEEITLAHDVLCTIAHGAENAQELAEAVMAFYRTDTPAVVEREGQ
jgi:hypothetical protein